MPVNCGGTGGAVCEPATFIERKNILELTHGGVLVLKQRIDENNENKGWDRNGTTSTSTSTSDNHQDMRGNEHERQEIKLEYLLATFGVKVNLCKLYIY